MKRHHYININNQPISYILRQQPKQKYLRMRICDYDGLVVSAPKYLSQKKITQFITQHRDWIEKNYLNQSIMNIPIPQSLDDYPNILDLLAIDKQYALVWRYNLNKNLTAQTHHNQLIIHGKMVNDYKIAYRFLCRKIAMIFYDDILTLLHYHAQKCNIEFQSLTLAWQKKRWGSCDINGHIRLNCKLLFCPKEWLDYVIIHELCHVIHHHHGAEFKQLLYQLYEKSPIIEQNMKNSRCYLPSWLFL